MLKNGFICVYPYMLILLAIELKVRNHFFLRNLKNLFHYPLASSIVSSVVLV